MKTRITQMLGIEHPIIQGGMHYVGFAPLAAAVSNAGGLGIITALTQKTPRDLANEISKCRDMTDKPIGVNLTFLPVMKAPDYPGYIKAIIEGGVKIVETAGRNPSQVMPILKDAGIKVIHNNTWPLLDLRVDWLATNPIEELYKIGVVLILSDSYNNLFSSSIKRVDLKNKDTLILFLNDNDEKKFVKKCNTKIKI